MKSILRLPRLFPRSLPRKLAQGRRLPGLTLFAFLVGLAISLSLVLESTAYRAIAQAPAPSLVSNGTPTGNVVSNTIDNTRGDLNDIGTVDAVPAQYQLGQKLYLESCATCHVGVPPEVLPRQTWEVILQDPAHYGVQLPPLVDPPRLLIWQYVQQFSRSLQEEEATPYRIRNSRFFKALHPRVEFSEPVQLGSCTTCHPSASAFNFRQLSPDWQDAP
ncbi:MAG: hypothetical protein ACFB8W_15035 [Elainellaceae cyanobacterium]